MIRSAVRLPIPGTAWKRRCVARRDRPDQLADLAPREDRQRDLGADRLDGEQHQEQVPLELAGEPEQREGVVADDQMGVQRGLAADGRYWRRVWLETSAPVADPVTDDHDVVGSAQRDLPAQERDHRRPHRVAEGPREGNVFKWQIATASASAA